MPRLVNRLSAKQVEAITEPGRYRDGGGLILDMKTGGKAWVFRYRCAGREREMGLGSASVVTLSRARALASEARELLASGVDPLSARKAAKEAARCAAARQATFGEVADDLVEAMRPGWKNEKHAAQWSMTLTEYAAPLRSLSIAEISTDDVLRVLKPIWQTKPETASWLRGRIERVLDAAKVRGMRSGENPAAWRGHLALVLSPPKKLSRGAHARLPYSAIGAFMRRLHARDAIAARALEFLILTASRTSEVICMRWDEVDLSKVVWTIPGSRMKAGREHRVPLSKPALSVLEGVKPLARDGWVFPGPSGDGRLSTNAFQMLLRRMDAGSITTHGFRSTFRDWIAEETNFANIVAEAALAHVVSNKAEAAYRRGDLLERRRPMMDAWAAYCAKPSKPVAVDQTEAA